jgi:hypothetical protein
MLKRQTKSTSNMLRHIKRFHSGKGPLQTQSLITNHATAAATYTADSTKKKELDRELMKFIAQDMRPLSIVEGAGFRAFCSKMDPRYKLPDRGTITRKLLPTMMKKEVEKLLRELSEAKSVTLTTDMWSSMGGHSFMAVTGHFITPDGLMCARLLDCSGFKGRHTSANITARLDEISVKFSVKNKIVCCVSDNANNVVKAIEDAGLEQIGCFAHKLNLIVQDALKIFPVFLELKKKMSDLVTFVHRSNNAREDLETCQVRLKMDVKCLVTDCPTRWNAAYLMIRRFCQLKDAIILFQTTPSGRGYSFSAEEWELAADVMALLAPLYEATVELSGELYVSGSKVIPMTKSLLAWYSDSARRLQNNRGNSFQHMFCSAILEKLYRRLDPVEMSTALSMATLCDPRYKKQGFRKPEMASTAVQKLKEEIRGNNENGPAQQQQQAQPLFTAASGMSLWKLFDQEVTARNHGARPSGDKIGSEVANYLGLMNIPRTSCPLQWWQNVGKKDFPAIFATACKYLSVPGTSVPSERTFSAAGGIITKKRSALADETAAMLIFLKENMRSEKKKN